MPRKKWPYTITISIMQKRVVELVIDSLIYTNERLEKPASIQTERQTSDWGLLFSGCLWLNLEHTINNYQVYHNKVIVCAGHGATAPPRAAPRVVFRSLVVVCQSFVIPIIGQLFGNGARGRRGCRRLHCRGRLRCRCVCPRGENRRGGSVASCGGAASRCVCWVCRCDCGRHLCRWDWRGRSPRGQHWTEGHFRH